ncbi:MAG: ParB N-terminal domain-containing protein [Eubacteriales bacterium]
MPKQRPLNTDLLADMLTNPYEQEGVQTLSLDVLQHFSAHKFKLYEGQQLSDMVTSVQELGILLPLIVWKKEDNAHIILSGHNRYEAAKLAGLHEVPVIVKEDLTEEEATLIVTETNLHQRSFSDLSHSERAFSLSQHYEAMKRQGKRTDILNELSDLLNPYGSKDGITSSENQTKLRSDQKLAQNYGLSKDKVARYIRLANLESSLLDLIDEGKIGVTLAYPLTFITDGELQNEIAEQVELGSRLNQKKADLLRSNFDGKKLDKQMVGEILSGEQTKKPKKVKPITLSKKMVDHYFKNHSKEEIETILEVALKNYFSNQKEECV